jgi:DNA repair protein RadC
MQAQKYSIKQWSKDDMPREKLREKGANTLSISELLAILINHGNKQKTAVDIAKEVLLMSKNNLGELSKLSIKELMSVNGIGEAKAITIMAALELGRRRNASVFFDKTQVKDSKDIAQYFKSMLQDHCQEVFAVAFMNQANKINHVEIISKGGITATIADPRIILKKALEEDAVSIILCHNHPSGNLKPSSSDQQLTKKIKEAAAYFDIKVLDHIIVSDEGYYSFADEGML